MGRVAVCTILILSAFIFKLRSKIGSLEIEMILWSAERWRRPNKYFPTYAAAARTICNTLLICVLRCIGASSYFKMLAAVAVVRSMYYLNVVSISTYSNKENRMVRMKNEATKFGLPLMSMYSGLELQINCKCT